MAFKSESKFDIYNEIQFYIFLMRKIGKVKYSQLRNDDLMGRNGLKDLKMKEERGYKIMACVGVEIERVNLI